MSKYTPDKFVVIDYGNKYSIDERYAILAGFYGGFAGNNSWKRSSPVVKWDVEGDTIIAHTFSGSKYVLHKGCVGWTMLTQSLASQASLTTIEEWEEIVKIAKGENDV